MLTDLVAGALADSADRRAKCSIAELEAKAHSVPPAMDVLAALAPRETVHVIAEIKRASPSRGMLAQIADPAALAAAYQSGGASAISVLTEGRRFGGSLDDLERVRAAVTVPVLRKDFIAEPYQVLEARASGADLVLLIVAALDDATLSSLFRLVNDLGMTPLIETHSGSEIDRALDLGADVIGVNARDLSTFELDRDLFGSLADMIPTDIIRVAESAVTTPADVAHYRAAGADVVLVGEALVSNSDPAQSIREFIAS